MTNQEVQIETSIGDTVMPDKSDTNPDPSTCEVEAVRYEYTIGRRLRKITLKTLAFVVVFSLGFILGIQIYTYRQLDDFHLFVYAYDTEQKLEDNYKQSARKFCDNMGLHPDSPEGKEVLAKARSIRPLVAVGPFAVLFQNDSGAFSVHEIQPSHVPLVILENQEHSKTLLLISSLEKGWSSPRFQASLYYSEDGIYKEGNFAVHGKDGMPERIYFDTKGIGVFDRMCVYVNGEQVMYHLNGLSWEKVNDKPESPD